MQVLAIFAPVFSSLSIVMPYADIFLAMICSILALVFFHSQPLLSGITLGLKVISSAFLSPRPIAAEVSAKMDRQSTSGSSIGAEVGYFFYSGFHLVLLLVALICRAMRSAPKTVV